MKSSELKNKSSKKKAINRQDPISVSVGKLVSIKSSEYGYDIDCDNAKIKIEIFNDNTIRVNTIQKEKQFESFSYSVIANPISTKHKYSEEQNEIIIQTEKIKVVITKNPCRISFFNHTGIAINQDHETFGTSWFGNEITSYKKLQLLEKFVGLGEKTGGLNRRGSSFTHWNNDYFAYPVDGDPLYLSTPFYIGIHSGLCYGLYYDNTYKSVMDFGASNDRFTSFQAADGEMDYYFFYDDSIAKIISHYTFLTGRVELPPIWSMGFQQCRYSYYPDKEVINLARTFREKDIPADVIYLDIHYMDEYKVFTWHPERFPNPDDMIAQLKEMGFHVILIVDPGVKMEEGYKYYEEGLKKNLFIQYPDGENYSGKVWPGTCHFPDFTNPETREWWGKNYKLHIDNGIEGYWNDMNEPATWGKRVPDIVEFDFDGVGASHRKAHNLYGMQMARSTYEGTKKLLNGKRPFVLTRSGFSGVQRYAAAWTGDNISSNEHMMAGIRLINSMGLTGLAFAGYDVGGFAGEPTTDLFARWMAIATFSPFFRCHSMINSRDAEPWAFGEEIEEISRNYIKLRYRLLPYIYSIFFEASQSGMPIQRSLVLDYMNDENIFKTEYENEYLFGPWILIAPVSSDKMISKIYLPDGGWYDFFTDKYYEGGKEILIETGKDKIPIFVKQGAVLPIQKPIAHTGADSGDIVEIHLYKGIRNETFTYYEDDGATFGYENNEFYKRKFTLNSKGKTLNISKKDGTYKSKFSKARVFFHGYTKKELFPQLLKNKLDLMKTDYRFVAPVSNFDPFVHSTDDSKVIKNIYYTKIDLVDTEMELRW